jgi:hypothetical protein
MLNRKSWLLKTAFCNTDKPCSRDALSMLAIGGLLYTAMNAFIVFAMPRMSLPFFLQRTWGIDAVKYLPLPLVAGIFSISVLVCVPFVNRNIVRSIDSLVSMNWPAGRKKAIFAVLSVLSIGFFYLLKSKYAFLGDSYLRIDDVVSNRFLITEFGTIFTLHSLYLALHWLFNWDGKAIFVLVSCLCGGAFTYFSLQTADALGKSRFEKAVIFCFYISSGFIQLFCGYVETYPLAVTFLAAFILSSIQWIKNTGTVITPIVCLTAAILCHLLSVLFVPSFLFILIVKGLSSERLRHRRTLAGLLSILCITVICTFSIDMIVKNTYPLFSTSGKGMTLFSFVHSWEFLNGMLLSCGIGLFLLFVLCALCFVKKIKMDVSKQFLLVASVFSITGVFILRLDLGSLDWDVISVSSIVINLCAITVLFDYGRTTSFPSLFKNISITACVFMALHTASFVLVNASDASIKRMKSICLSDPSDLIKSRIPETHLSWIFSRNGLDKESNALLRTAYLNNPKNPRAEYYYANLLINSNVEFDSAFSILMHSCARVPYYMPSHKLAIKIYLNQGNLDSASKYIERVYRIYCVNPMMLSPYISRDELIRYFTVLAQVKTRNNKSEAGKILRTISGMTS